jgi:GTP-binding protein LepA
VAYKAEMTGQMLARAKKMELTPVEGESGLFWIKNPKDFPDEVTQVLEPMTQIEILTPMQYLGNILQLKELYRISDIMTETIGSANSGRMLIKAKLPLADLIADFDDKLKSVSQGYGSLSYEVVGYQKGDVDKMEILVAENLVPGLTRILPRDEIEYEARKTCAKLKDLLPKQQFKQPIQAQHRGRIIARETIPAESKELGNFGKNGGDRTRKMKLWKKQARGKERLEERSVNSGVKIPASVFKELLKK